MIEVPVCDEKDGGFVERRRLFAFKESEGNERPQSVVGRVGVLIGIWGHRVSRPDGTTECVFYLLLTVVDSAINEAALCDCERDFELPRGAVGLAEDQRLEEVLTSETLRLLNQELPRG